MSIQNLPYELALAHRLLVGQGVLDAFGHISLRDPHNPEQFYLPVACPPSCVEPGHIELFDLSGQPLADSGRSHFSERYIHAAIFRARPDVHAVCHHHAPAIMPFSISTAARLAPVSQTGAAMGAVVPVWDSQHEFGATRLLLSSNEQSDSLARTLGQNWLVLMRRHGATVVGRSLTELVFRAVHACRDAEAIQRAQAFGAISYLSPEECQLASTLRAEPMRRCWQHWEKLLPANLRLSTLNLTVQDSSYESSPI